MTDSLKQKAISGVVWKFLEKFSLQAFSFVVGIVLARLLMPSDYGLVTMANIFFAVSYLLIDSGFSTALVRMNERTEKDYSTAYVTNVILSLFFSLILIALSSWMSEFYHEPRLKSIVIVNAIFLFLGSLIAVQNIRLTINLQFKEQSVINVIINVFTGICSIIMALLGYGAWSLVIPSGLAIAVRGIAYWEVQHWFPKIDFSKDSFKSMFSFGFKITLTALLKAIYNNIYSLVIGRKFTAEDLGYYNRGNSYASMPAETVANTLGSVSYPILSKIQDDFPRLSSAYRRMISLSGYVVFPIMIGLAVLAHPLVIVLVTDKWEACVPYLQVLCLALMWSPIHSLNYNLLQTTGRADLRLRVEIVQKVLCIIVLFITIPHGILVMCFGSVAVAVLSLLINTYYTGKMIDVGFLVQMKDLLPSLLMSLLMGALVWLAIRPIGHLWMQIIVGFLVGALSYWIMSLLLKSTDYRYLLSLVKDIFKQ